MMSPLGGKSSNSAGGCQFWIDVGGTFTDCLMREPDGVVRRCKVLSSGRTKGRILARTPGIPEIQSSLADFPGGFFRGYRIRFFSDVGDERFQCHVGESAEGRVVMDEALPAWVQEGCRFEVSSDEPAPLLGIRRLLGLGLEAEIGPAELRLGTTLATNALLERKGVRTAWVTTQGFEDLLAIGNQDRPRLFDLHIRKPSPLYECTVGIDERIDSDGCVLHALDVAATRRRLADLKEQGIQSLAICLMNAYCNSEHERSIRELAEPLGFEHVSLSSEVSPTIRIVPRGDTTLIDAYLTPVVRKYFESISQRLPNVDLRIMTSAGVLSPWDKVSGKDLILSGPAGGVVGFARAAKEAGWSRAIGFDMGGTSTDVSRFDGDFEYEFETKKAGVRIVTPMLSIETVAAGGGSICGFDGQRLTVGPASAGADPGPACYGRGGPLAVTDLNLFLGRVPEPTFPFKPDRKAVERSLGEVVRRVRDSGDPSMKEAEIAEGFLRIANSHMAAAIKRISIARGYDIRDYGLVSFGGAAGQHACAVARELGITKILIHPMASLLSAYGIGTADPSEFAVESVLRPLSLAAVTDLSETFAQMESRVTRMLPGHDKVGAHVLETQRLLEVRYRGQSSTLTVTYGELGDIRSEFETQHRQLYGHLFEAREIEIVNARVQVTLKTGRGTIVNPSASGNPMCSVGQSLVQFDGELRETPHFEMNGIAMGDEIQGPALLLEAHSTIVLEPGWSARMTPQGSLILEADLDQEAVTVTSDSVNAVDLEIFHNHFASIAEQMGATLRRTALSVNVKERLDFSCAIFTAAGDLVANAPHVPVHLGAMSECVKHVLREVPDLAPGDVILTNDPFRGGSHLPDLTVISPVFSESGALLFLTGNRAHHAEIGGIRPGSMPPDSRNLAEEGVLIRNFKVVEGGKTRFDELEAQLRQAPYPSRSPEENLADIGAQIAANRQGIVALRALLERFGRDRTLEYMGHIQQAAEVKMRDRLRRMENGLYRFSDSLDDGSPICVSIEIRDDSATLNFEGSAPVHPGNLNANRAIVTAAVIYVFRCLIEEDIPLNSGVLGPLTLTLPEGILNPAPDENPARCPGVVGGNVETSQRIVDVLLGALGAAAASQGTMNNLTFGNERFGYYETVCGGAGAGPGFDGADAVHTHMTNTRLTDAEVLEREYPVRLRRFEIRRGSGGAGQFKGGAGVIREIEFLEPVSVSLLTQRRNQRPFGLMGGLPGKEGRNRLLRSGEGGGGLDLGGCGSFDAVPGDRLIIETPGGGGYGAPSASRSVG